jgi:hypothetical protein
MAWGAIHTYRLDDSIEILIPFFPRRIANRLSKDRVPPLRGSVSQATSIMSILIDRFSQARC